jgi:hypothetical protein
VSLLFCLNPVLKNPRLEYIVNVTEWCLPCGVVRDLKETVSALERWKTNFAVYELWLHYIKQDIIWRLSLCFVTQISLLIPSQIIRTYNETHSTL